MTKSYLGKLQLEAIMPDDLSLSEFINVSVDFEIICPVHGPKCNEIVKNGFDRKVKGNPQLFLCKKKKKSFYPHTSWIFVQFTALIIEVILDRLFVENLSPKAIARICKAFLKITDKKR